MFGEIEAFFPLNPDNLDLTRLAFLIAAQHQGVLGRVQVQAHNSFEFLRKSRIFTDLKGLYQVRFQTVCPPNAPHTGRADGSAERDAALLMLYKQWRSRRQRRRTALMSVGADKAYDTRDFVETVREMDFWPHVTQNVKRPGGSTPRSVKVRIPAKRAPGPLACPDHSRSKPTAAPPSVAIAIPRKSAESNVKTFSVFPRAPAPTRAVASIRSLATRAVGWMISMTSAGGQTRTTGQGDWRMIEYALERRRHVQAIQLLDLLKAFGGHGIGILYRFRCTVPCEKAYTSGVGPGAKS